MLEFAACASDGTGIWGFVWQRCGFVAENGGVGWRCYMECGIFVATVQMTPEGAGCVANLDVMLCLIVV